MLQAEVAGLQEIAVHRGHVVAHLDQLHLQRPGTNPAPPSCAAAGPGPRSGSSRSARAGCRTTGRCPARGSSSPSPPRCRAPRSRPDAQARRIDSLETPNERPVRKPSGSRSRTREPPPPAPCRRAARSRSRRWGACPGRVDATADRAGAVGRAHAEGRREQADAHGEDHHHRVVHLVHADRARSGTAAGRTARSPECPPARCRARRRRRSRPPGSRAAAGDGLHQRGEILREARLREPQAIAVAQPTMKMIAPDSEAVSTSMGSRRDHRSGGRPAARPARHRRCRWSTPRWRWPRPPPPRRGSRRAARWPAARPARSARSRRREKRCTPLRSSPR